VQVECGGRSRVTTPGFGNPIGFAHASSFFMLTLFGAELDDDIRDVVGEYV
jgi:hypothetical protein